MERTQANEKTDNIFTDFCIIVIHPLGSYLYVSIRCSSVGKAQYFMQLTLRYDILSITGFNSSMIVSPFLAFDCCRLPFCEIQFGCNRLVQSFLCHILQVFCNLFEKAVFSEERDKRCALFFICFEGV